MAGNSIILCLVSSILLILSFPKFNLSILAWMGFIPLFFALENKAPRKAFLWSYLSGVFFFLGTIYWLAHVTFAGMIALVLYLALYFGVFGLSISGLGSRAPGLRLLFIPSIWVILEFLRSHLLTGFGWVLLGHSQYQNLSFIQIVDITGTYGVSFLLMLVNVIIYQTLRQLHLDKKKVFDSRNLLIVICILLLVFGYGLFRLNQKPGGRKIRISVIQGNIPQKLKWQESARDFIWDRYLRLTQEVSAENPDLIIWPESAIPDYFYTQIIADSNNRLSEIDDSNLEYLFNFVREIKVPILLGVTTIEDEDYYNSAILVSKDTRVISRYDKIHLVPFGEYIPLRRILPFLETIVPIGDFTSGRRFTVFRSPARFSVLICFEDIFPELARRFVNQGADLLVNITNDAWFGETSAPYQHMSCSVFRAAENRCSLVRAANTGISCFIDSNGRIISKVQGEEGQDIFTTGFKTEEIRIFKRQSFYTKFGDIFIYILALVMGYSLIKIFKTKKYV